MWFFFFCVSSFMFILRCFATKKFKKIKTLIHSSLCGLIIEERREDPVWGVRVEREAEAGLISRWHAASTLWGVGVFLSLPWSQKMSMQEWRATRTQTKKEKKMVFSRSSSVSVISRTSRATEICVWVCVWWESAQVSSLANTQDWRGWEGRRCQSLDHFGLIYDRRASAAVHPPAHQRSHTVHAQKAHCNVLCVYRHTFMCSWLGCWLSSSTVLAKMPCTAAYSAWRSTTGK